MPIVDMKCLRISACLIACLALAGCDDYGKQLTQDFKNVYNLNGPYQWSGYPVDNFGVGTCYLPSPGKKFNDGDRQCATWTCLGLDKQIPTDPDARLKIAGFADVGGGGTITLSQAQTTLIQGSVVLPSIMQILGVTGDAKWEKKVQSDMKFGKAHSRSLNRTKFVDEYMNKTPKPEGLSDSLKQAFDHNQLTIIVADLVLDSLSAKITFDATREANLEAALQGKAQQFVGQDAKATFKFSRTSSGTYTLEVTQPVVLAVLPKQQKAGSPLAALSEQQLKEWTDYALVTLAGQRPGPKTPPKGLIPLRQQ